MKVMIGKYIPGIGICGGIALASQWLGQRFPLVGGAIFALLIGMMLVPLVEDSDRLNVGLTFTSKKILQSLLCYLVLV